MSAYVDGELTGVEMLEIRRHISECPDCAEEHESILATKVAVSRLGAAMPRRDLAHSILTSLDAVQVTPYQRAANMVSRFLHSKLSPVAAALAASGVALVLLSAGGMDGVPAEPSSAVAAVPVQDVAFIRDLNTAPLNLPTNRPLEVADQSMTLGRQDIQLISFSTTR